MEIDATHIEYFPLLIQKKDQIWLILQGSIVIPVESVFVDKIALGRALSQNKLKYNIIL